MTILFRVPVYLVSIAAHRTSIEEDNLAFESRKCMSMYFGMAGQLNFNKSAVGGILLLL